MASNEMHARVRRALRATDQLPMSMNDDDRTWVLMATMRALGVTVVFAEDVDEVAVKVENEPLDNE